MVFQSPHYKSSIVNPLENFGRKNCPIQQENMQAGKTIQIFQVPDSK